MSSDIIVACGPAATPRGFDSVIAQARAYEWFRQDFMKRFPAGVVMTEFEYLGRTTFAAAGGTPVQFPGKPLISALIDSMSLAFRKGLAFADFRKPDGMGLVELGRSVRVELLEVTTEKNFRSAVKQMGDKISTLARTVVGNAGSPFPVEVVGTPWSAGGSWQKTCPSIPDSNNKEFARWVCFLPTLRNSLPAGVSLYEVHAAMMPMEPVPVRKFSDESEKVLQRGFLRARTDRATAEDTGQRLPTLNPQLQRELFEMAAVAGVIVTVGAVSALCIAAIVDPVPGDEVVACAFAVKVVQTATAR